MKKILVSQLNDGDTFERCLIDFWKNTDAPVLILDPFGDDVVYVTAQDEYGDLYADFTMTVNHGGEARFILIDEDGNEEEKYLYDIETRMVYSFT